MNTSQLRPLTELEALESESIHIFREVAATFASPTMLFSGGKDSVVMLHLAAKAFWPAPIPFGLLHVDTGHNFPEVLDYRDEAVGEMPEGERPMWVTRIVLRPQITLGSPAPRAKVERLVEVAHRECFIAQSVRSEIVLEPVLVGVTD